MICNIWDVWANLPGSIFAIREGRRYIISGLSMNMKKSCLMMRKKMPFHSGKQFHSPLPAYRKGQKTKYACYLENRVNWHKNEVCRSTLQDEWGQSRQSVLSKSFGVRKIHWISMTTCLWVKSTESQRKGSFATKPLHELEI